MNNNVTINRGLENLLNINSYDNSMNEKTTTKKRNWLSKFLFGAGIATLMTIGGQNLQAQNIDYSKLTAQQLEILAQSKKLETKTYAELSAKDLETIRLAKELIRSAEVKNGSHEIQTDLSDMDYLMAYENYVNCVNGAGPIPDIYKQENEFVRNVYIVGNFHKKDFRSNYIWTNLNKIPESVKMSSPYLYLIFNQSFNKLDKYQKDWYKEQKTKIKTKNPALYYVIEAQEYMFGSFKKPKSHENARNNLAMTLAISANAANNKNLPEEIKNNNDYIEYLNNPNRTAEELNELIENSNLSTSGSNFDRDFYAICGWAVNTSKSSEKTKWWKESKYINNGKSNYSLTKGNVEEIYFNLF